MNNLYLLKQTQLTLTHNKRKHFRYKVREVIRTLHNNEFISLCLECLHSNHYPLLEQYINNVNEWSELPNKRNNDKRVKDIKYLLNSHRRTITNLLTGLENDSYKAEVTEWLIIHGYWVN